MEQSKRCKRCGNTKALDDFYPHPQCKMGVRPECKTCTGKAQEPYREQHRARQRKYARQWHDTQDRDAMAAAWRERYASDPEFREKRKAASRANYYANKDKHAARRAVQVALKSGALVAESCLFCDDPKVDAHHHSYAPEDRLNVTWLCETHHGLAHRIVDEPARPT